MGKPFQYIAGSIFCILLLAYCKQSVSDVEIVESPFLNLADSVTYVGQQVCISCHSNVHATFSKTGMGQSFGKAILEKTAATFGPHALVYDDKNDFYYYPYFKDSIFYIDEFRLDGKDTIHKRTEQVDYIIGSGHHTNSHIIQENGYIYQAPITFYTQEGIWDLAPGFRDNKNERFSRTLDQECLTCHNHYPTFAEGSSNKVLDMPLGIQCERCHGPGSLHAKEKLAGIIVDTATTADYTIVNPRRLSRDLQMDLCMRCHLQGTTVLEPGKTFFDFRPGMELSSVMNTFLPRSSGSDRKFIMASQADRLRQSPCYINSEMTCLSCHHPHQSVRTLPEDYFNKKCQSCHQEMTVNECTATAASRNLKNDDCVSCHMPKAGSLDIPHISITDHNIQRHPAVLQPEPPNAEKAFFGLQILTKNQASPLEMTKAYLAFYDKYAERPLILDSAAFYLNQCRKLPQKEILDPLIHYYFNRNYQDSILRISTTLSPNDIKDPWTAYRIGQTLYNNGNLPKAISFFENATSKMPFELDFQEKLGVAYLAANELKKSEAVWNFILKEQPKRSLALTNLGYLKVLQGNWQAGEALYNQAIALDPDYIQAILNKAAVALQTNRQGEAVKLLQRILSIDPNHQQARQALKQIGGGGIR